MPATNLGSKVFQEATPRQQKGAGLITSASKSLTSSFTTIITWTDDISGETVDSTGWVNCGNAPCVGVTLLWTYAGSATLTILPWLSNDSAFTKVHAGYVIRDAGATATDGLVTAYPAGIQIPKGSIASVNGFDVGGGATTLYAPLVISTEGFRYFRLQAKSNNNDGSLIAYAAVGTNL